MQRIPLRHTTALLFLAATLFALASPSQAQTVEYPVLVYSTLRGQHDVPATIHITNASQAVSLCVTTHQAGYHMGDYIWANWNRRDDAAGLRLNGGNVVTDWNSTGTVDYPADHYEGVGGAYHTVRTCFPVNGGSGSLGAVQEGANTVSFRFYGVRDLARSGYRVIDIDVENAAGTDLITSEVHDDPEQWTIANTVGGAYDNAAAIAQGEALWSARNSLQEIDGSKSIVAACNDCHAYNGFDLKYFNYESDVLVARATHHGLSEEQGRYIAAYIRSVDLERPDGRETTPKGRPWNPPYQPGPGLNDGLEEDWSAGTGLEWVLTDDEETFDYLFSADGVTPNPNPTPAEMAAVFDVGEYAPGGAWGNQIDVQNLPVAIQYPDWNNWLPDVHPFESFGFSDFTGTLLWTDHNNMYTAFDTQQKRDAINAFTRNYIRGTSENSGAFDVFRRVDFEWDNWGPTQSIWDIPYADGSKPAYYLGKLSFMQWEAVKSWEVMSRYKMFDLSDEWAEGATIPSGPYAGEEVRFLGSLPEHDAPFFWPSHQHVVFNLAPHKFGEPGFRGEGAYGPPGTEVMQSYFSTAWYDLSLILSVENAGFPANNGGTPVNWDYMAALLSNAQQDSGLNQWARAVRQRVFAWQSRNNAWMQRLGPNAGPSLPRGEMNWFELVGFDPRHSQGIWPGAFMPDQNRALDILFAATQEWIDFIASVPVEEWDRGAEGSRTNWAPSTYTPEDYSGGYRFIVHRWANNAYRMPPYLSSLGAPASLTDDIATWGAEMWPNGNWEQWIMDGPPPVEPVQQSIELNVGWNLVSSYVAPSDSSMSAVWSPLAGQATLVRNALGHEFDPATGSGSLGFWRRGEAYQVHMTESATLTLQGELVVPEATPISLNEGWNQVAYLGTSQAPVADALSAILSDLVILKQNDGTIFMPGVNLDQIGSLRPGAGYRLLLSEDAVLVYPPMSGIGIVPDAPSSRTKVGIPPRGERSSLGTRSPR